MLRTLIASLFALCCGVSYAGVLSKASVGGQVQQFLSDGKVTSCGITLYALEEVKSPSDVLSVFNGAFMVAGPAGGLMKGRLATVSASQILAGNFDPAMLRPVKTEMVWLKAQGAEATMLSPGQKVLPSDDPGYITYLTPLPALVAVLSAVFEETPIQIGMKASDGKFDIVLFGKVVMSDEDKAALAACLREWKSNLVEKAPAL